MPDPDGTSRRPPGPKRAPGEPIGPDEVRSAVVDAASRLFARYGVEAVTIRDIAAEANVQHGLISRYIGRREVLIDEVYRHVTRELVSDIEARPLQARSFDRDSVMGAWTVLVTHYSLRQALPPSDVDNPVQALARGIEDHYGLSPDQARWRAAQIVGSAVGWRLFEPMLLSMGDLPARDAREIRADLVLLHNIVGSLSLPTPDPRPDSQR